MILRRVKKKIILKWISKIEDEILINDLDINAINKLLHLYDSAHIGYQELFNKHIKINLDFDSSQFFLFPIRYTRIPILGTPISVIIPII